MLGTPGHKVYHRLVYQPSPPTSSQSYLGNLMTAHWSTKSFPDKKLTGRINEHQCPILPATKRSDALIIAACPGETFRDGRNGADSPPPRLIGCFHDEKSQPICREVVIVFTVFNQTIYDIRYVRLSRSRYMNVFPCELHCPFQ